MGKFFSRFLLLLLVTIVSLIIYLSYFGINTDKFDDLIKNKANEVNQNVELEFQKTKIHLNIKELNLVVKLQNSKVLIRGNAIDLSKLDLFLSLKSIFSSDFLLKRAEVAFIENDIKDLTKIANIFLPKLINKKLNKIFAKGNIRGEFIIPFETDGSIGKDYGFTGKISDASINLTKEFSIKNLTTEIRDLEYSEAKGFEVIIKKGFMYDLDLADTTINLRREKNEIKIKSLLRTNGKLNFSQIKIISSLFGLNIDNLRDINGTADLKTNINFDLDKQFKVKNLSYSTEGDVAYVEIHTEERRTIKKYLPEYDPKIILKDTNIKLINSKSNNTLELNGFIKIKNNFDSFKIKEVYNYDKKSFYVNGVIDLTNSKVKVSRLNYNKDHGKISEISFDVNFVLNKYYNIESLHFLADKNKIHLSNIKLNKNFEVIDFKKLEIKTFLNEIKNNDFLVKKLEKVTISGEVFDAQPLLKSLYKTSDKKTFDKN